MNRTRLPLIISPEAFNELPSKDELLIVAVVQKAVFDAIIFQARYWWSLPNW